MRSLYNIVYRLLLICALSFTPILLHAATYYVDVSVANNDAGNGSQASPKQYISSGIALMSSSGGDTLIIAPGTYSDPNDAINSVVNGKPGAYNVIKAQTDGTVTINRNLALTRVGASQAQYVQFEGLKWRSKTNKAIIGHHIKILRCAFEGGPASGNTSNFSIGTNNQTPGSRDILIEDTQFYGAGGRYELLVFNSDSIVLRRIVVRHDLGWCFVANANPCTGNGPPEAGLSVYSSKNIQVQNFLIIDSNQQYFYWEAAFYIINNTNNLDNDNTVVEGSLSINNLGVSYKYDGSKAVTNSVIRNSVSYGGNYFAIGLGAQAGSDSTLKNLTIIGNSGHGIQVGYSSSTFNLTNSVLVGNGGRGINYDASGSPTNWSESYNNCSNNTVNGCPGTGDTGYDAYTNGLLYPIRIESGSTLDTAGASGSTVGANITNRLGVSGTLYGETGYATETSQSLWPWPQETRIKNDMCNEINTGVADRGWCATNLSLTDYIWGLLNNPLPGGLSPMPTPGNIRSTKN